MSILFIGIACAIFLLSLPAVLEVGLFIAANLLLRYRALSAGSGPGGTPVRKIAVLVPAHNESKGIARAVKSILAADFGPYEREVVVVADNCGDDTAALARGAGARVIERIDESRRGKGAALQYAFSVLDRDDFDAYIVVDADTEISADLIKAFGDAFSAGSDALQCVNLPRNPDESPRTRLSNLAFVVGGVFRPMGREKLGLSAGIQGNGFGLSKRAVRQVPYTANSVTEDFEYHLMLVEAGIRVHFLPNARVLSDFPVSEEGTRTQRVRWEGGRFLLQRTYGPRLFLKALSGKARILEPFLDLMSMPLSYEVLLLLSLAVLPGQPFRWFGAVGLSLIIVEIIAAIALFGRREDWKSLLEVPSYIIWKIAMLPRILLGSRKGGKWVRTKRD